MIGLPKSTEFDRRIPKQKFYENLSVTPILRDVIKNQIKTIYWRNKIAPSTVNVAAGKDVTEIEVFEVKIMGETLDETVLRQIDKEIPYHILFLLENNEMYQAWIGYKENALSGSNAFKVSSYYHTDWMKESELPVHLDGLDMDAVYENYVRQIAGDAISSEEGKTESLKESVERDNHRQELEKQITTLQIKVHKEKQLNKQVELNVEIKKLRKELNSI